MQIYVGDQDVTQQDISLNQAQGPLYIDFAMKYRIILIQDVSLNPVYVHFLEQIDMSNGEKITLLPYTPPHPPSNETHQYIVSSYITDVKFPNIKFEKRRINITKFLNDYSCILLESNYILVHNDTNTPPSNPYAELPTQTVTSNLDVNFEHEPTPVYQQPLQQGYAQYGVNYISGHQRF